MYFLLKRHAYLCIVVIVLLRELARYVSEKEKGSRRENVCDNYFLTEASERI